MKTTPETERSPNHTWTPDGHTRKQWRKDKQRVAAAQSLATQQMREKPLWGWR